MKDEDIKKIAERIDLQISGKQDNVRIINISALYRCFKDAGLLEEEGVAYTIFMTEVFVLGLGKNQIEAVDVTDMYKDTGTIPC